MSSSHPSKGSMRARVGSLMRRTSSGLSFTRPSTPSRSSTESLRLDSASLATASLNDHHKLPSPVPESPAREGAAEAAEALGPSPLAAPPMTASAPIDIPAPKALEPDVIPWASANVVTTPDQMSVVGSVPATQSAGDTEVHEVAPSERAGTSEGSTDSHPHSHHRAQSEGPPATEMVAAPWGQSMDVQGPAPDSRPETKPEPAPEPKRAPSVTHNPWLASGSTTSLVRDAQQRPADDAGLALADTASDSQETTSAVATPRPFEHPSLEQGLARKKSVASIASKPRTRTSTASSQARPVTPGLIVNGTISPKPSKSSLAPSTYKTDDAKHVSIAEPTSEDHMRERVLPGYAFGSSSSLLGADHLSLAVDTRIRLLTQTLRARLSSISILLHTINSICRSEHSSRFSVQQKRDVYFVDHPPRRPLESRLHLHRLSCRSPSTRIICIPCSFA